jgi:hypothetical protein
MAVGIGLDNFSKIFGFNSDISAFDWTSGGVLHDSLKTRRPSPDTERCEEQANETKDE